MAILECVANISEGRRPTVIEAIAQSISGVTGVSLLHIDTGYAANRTVFTFAGEPTQVMEAAFRMYKAAFSLINMAEHVGTHPRQGAVDVAPFIPLNGISLDETNELVYRLSERLSTEIGIGGYFYEKSAREGRPSDLSVLRKGQYEGIPEKLKSLPLDFGTDENYRRFGITVTGCRRLLMAYNVNLDTTDASLAHKIAQQVRASGYADHTRPAGTSKVPGRLKGVKGLGWYIGDYGLAQASYNITDLNLSGLLDVFNTTEEIAALHGVKVKGSELIGLAPVSEFIKVAQYAQNNTQLDQEQAIEIAAKYLGLGSVRAFDPKRQILDLLIAEQIDTSL